MPAGRGSGAYIAVALVAAFLAVVSLVLPWFVIVGRARSSIDLISSASALDVIEGGVKTLVIAGWLISPLLVSISMLVAASGRHRLAAGLILPITLGIVAAFVVGIFVDAIGLAWGALFGTGFAIIAAIFAMMVLVPRGTESPISLNASPGQPT